MVKIKFYQDPIKSDFTEISFNTLMDYLIENCSSRDELLNLRFFHDEILGQEIDQSDVSFLEISEGTIAITFDSMIPRTPDMWIYVAIAVIVSVATILLIPKIPSIGRDQSSATNQLGSSTNEPRINERIDDIFGTVTKHTPPLWQVPYRIGVDNEETEILLLAVGRGKYLIEQNTIFDGSTRIVDIPNAQFSKYEPNTYPGNGTPSLQIGPAITEKIGVYRQSNDLNPSELLPPNELSNTGLKWKLTGNSATEGLMEAILIPDSFDFEEYYTVGDIVVLKDINYLKPKSITTVTLYYSGGTQQFNAYDLPIDLGESESLLYEITVVTSDTITVKIPNGVSQDVADSWAAMSNYTTPELSYFVFNFSNISFYTDQSSIEDRPAGDWYEDVALTIPILFVNKVLYNQFVTEPFSGVLGPFVVPDDADEIILNFVSESGFYKLDNNNERRILDSINVRVSEIDSLGVATGLFQDYTVPYNSNTSITKSVFQTSRITLPYSRSKVSASRNGDRDKSTGISNVDVIKWRDLYSFQNVTGLDFGDVTLAHVVIPSNSESRLIKERKQNMNVTRLVTQYLGDGVFGPTETFATDNFAQILTHMSLDERIGRLTIDNINADGFLSLSDQITEYFGSSDMVKFGHDFDDTQVTYQDSFIQICEVVNCLPYVQNGVYDAFFEKLQTISSAQITCRNKIENSESREQIFVREFDGVEVSYRDELTSISETVYIPNDRSAVNPDRITLTGCVTELQAFRYAARKFNKQVYNRFKVSFDVDEFGRNIIPGKRIDSPDSTRFTQREGVTDGYRVYDGEVIQTVGLTSCVYSR